MPILRRRSFALEPEVRVVMQPVSGRPSRPLEALRNNSEQLRQAMEFLADLAEDTAGTTLPSARATLAGDPDAEVRAATILQAQRSFAATLRLAQLEDRPTGRPPSSDQT